MNKQPLVNWGGQRPMDIGGQLDKARREKPEPLKLPLHMHNLKSEREYKLSLQARADNAMRMFSLNPRGFRINKDGTSPFVHGRFVAAGLTEADKPEPSKRAQKKRLALGMFLLNFRENPKQRWTNWQRSHNGQVRPSSIAANA